MGVNSRMQVDATIWRHERTMFALLQRLPCSCPQITQSDAALASQRACQNISDFFDFVLTS
jgi:serine phosphatase RsbU (regulator of sigma subunit)